MSFSTWATTNHKATMMARRNAAAREWYILRVAPLSEGRVVTILPALDIAAFVPVEQKVRKVRGAAGIQLRSVPILSGYVLGGFERPPSWFSLFSTVPSVVGVVAVQGAPWRLSGADLDRLFGMDHAPALPGQKSLKPGDEIRIVRGGFSGQTSQLIDVDGVDCEFIVRMLGKDHRVRRPIHEIEAA